jgi:uncharacterized membrane protein
VIAVIIVLAMFAHVLFLCGFRFNVIRKRKGKVKKIEGEEAEEEDVKNNGEEESLKCTAFGGLYSSQPLGR